MSGVFSVKIKLDTAKAVLKLRTQFVNEKLISDVQKLVVEDEIKRQMRRGVSPVRGFGRYGEYLNPTEYPGKGKQRLKPSRPVNLFLTGEMQSWLMAFKKQGNAIFVGIKKSAPKFVKIKAEANNLGTTRNGVGAVPRRRFIPQIGEQWNVTIIRKIKDLFAKRTKELLNK